ncbi:MAG: alpha/beta fold hydrolase [Chloroflexota bacterium]
MTDPNLLQAAQSAFRTGDRKTAAAHFARLVQADPDSEEGWLGLGLTLEDTEKRIYCLRRALELDPENQAARQALDWLQTPPPPAAQPAPTAAVFIEEKAPPQKEEPPAPPAEIEQAPAWALPKQEEPPAKPAPPKKKRSSGLVWFFVILILCSLSAAGLFLAYSLGLLDAYLPDYLLLPTLSQPTSQPAASSPTSPLNLPTATPPSEPSLTPTPAATVVYSPAFEEGDCPFENPGEGEISCGYVVVPENRTRSAADTIRLAVVVYQATGPDPAAEPVIFLQGGPGAGAVELSAYAYSILVEPFLEKHTFITFDQRGTGLSDPILNCDELTQVYSQDLRNLVPIGTRDLVYLNAFRACHDLLTIQGVDLTAHTTADNAADVRDVLLALGHTRADLFGVSYGTRLGQAVMRDYPEIVRSAVLDSMLPMEVNVYASSGQSAETSLRTLFDSCAADTVCAAAYPDLEADFWSLVDSLNASPISVPVVVPFVGGRSYVSVDGGMYLNQIMASLKQTWMIPGVPQSIDQVKSGDTSSLSYTLGFPPVDWDLEISLGMYISIMCHEYVMDSDAGTLTAGLGGKYYEGELGWFPFVGDGQDYINLCEVWDAVPPAAGEDEPVTNDIPTLVIAGKFDSITPPTFSQQVAGHLPNSFYLEFPDQGHAPTAASNTDCPMQTVLSFFDHPDTGPDSACLAEEQGPQFLVPYTGAEPIPLTAVTLFDYSLSVSLPTDWYDYGGGTFLRYASGLDITQLNVFRVEMTPAQALSFLSDRTFYGRMMLDSEPIPAGERQAGFTWDLYTTTSFGTPVDMALTNDRGTTIMVIFFTHTNEHDALYENVFLPVVDSVRSTE